MDGPIVLRTCPIRAFTSEVREWLAWFELFYTIEAHGFGGARCVRTAWPAGGGAGDQDARLTMALDYVAGVVNTVIAESTTTHG